MKEILVSSEIVRLLPVGSRVWFVEDKRPFTVQANRGKGFLVLSKPFAARKTVLYTIIDIKGRIRGPEDLIFGRGAETRKQCLEMMMRVDSGETSVSRRRSLPLAIAKIEIAPDEP